MADNQVTDLSAPSDGQIALTAHNDGDGTWSVTRGPKGAVLASGLPREKALAIVGAGVDPSNEQEAAAAAERAKLEAKSAEITQAEAEKADDPSIEKTPRQRGGQTPAAAVGNAGDGGAKGGNGGEAFDHDGNGKVGGSKPKA